MNQTNYIILKLLLQQPLEEKEILKYLNINIFTLRKSIVQINNKLKNLKLPTIKQTNNIYQIRLSQSQKDFFYSSCTDYSKEQRHLYLTLKLLINKNINLTIEKNNLNISRATIDRDIYFIKNNLIKKKIFIISKKWKGLFLHIIDNNNYYEYICEILIVLYSEYKYLPGVLKSFLVNLQKDNIDNLISEFFYIYDDFNIQIGNISLRYFLSLRICVNLEINFQLYNILTYIKTIEKDPNFQHIYSILTSKFFLKGDYALYISMNIYDTLYKKFYLENHYKSKVESYCNYFNVILTNESRYLLTFFLFISNFRYKNNLYEVRNIYLKSSFDNILLNKLIFFLKSIHINILYGDLLELLDFTKFFILTTNSNYKKNILILKKDINIVYFSNLEEKLKLTYPNFNFDIKPYVYLSIIKNNHKAYDLILSDIILDLDFKYKLCQVNTSLNTLINDYLIEDMLDTIN